MTRSIAKATLFGATCLTLFSLAGTAHAQINGDTPAPPVSQDVDASATGQQATVAVKTEEPSDTNTIVVTGSRIASRAATSASPLQIVSAEQIRSSGSINVQDVLLKNPVFGTPGFSRTNTASATSGAGVATIDLRNLGSDRTLVLVDGKRFVAGVPGSASVDLNVIPTQMLERVDVLTGGASAVYGSDAIAGVVNFVYKTRFDGLQFDGQQGISQYGDGYDRQANLLFGKNFSDGRGNIMLFGGYSHEGAVFKKNRSTEGGSSDQDTTSEGASITGDPTQIFTPYTLYSGYIPGGRFYAGDQRFSYGSDNILRDCTATSCGTFNRSDYRYLAVPLDRYTAAGRANYEFSPALNVYLEGNYARTESKTIIEPFPLASNLVDIATGGQVPIQTVVNGVTYRNPFVPDAIFNAATDTDGDGLKDIYFDRRLSDLGARTSDAKRTLFRIAGGINGRFLDDKFSYEVYGVYGQSVEHQTGNGQYDSTKFTQALNAYRDPVTGAIQCADPAARAAGCVPANIYGINALASVASYIAAPVTLDSKITQTVAGGNVGGDVFSMFGADPVAFSVGGEYRRETSRSTFDLLTQQGLNGNNALPPTSGSFHVFEGYAEAIAPILKERPFFYDLRARGAVRVSDYTTVGRTVSYNYGGEWAPISSIRFRVIAARSVRAPNVNELFQPAQQDFPSGLQDPCAGVTATSTGAVSTNCRAAPGVNANIAANGAFTVTQSDLQGITSFAGGNPNLSEEKGDSFTAGVVITPKNFRPLRNFVMTVDYYNIRVKGAIVSTPLQYILTQCYTLNQLCNFVTRRPTAVGANSPGSIYSVNSGPTNSGGGKTAGIDVTATYNQDMQDLGLPGQAAITGSYTHVIRGFFVPLPASDPDRFEDELGGSRDKFTTTISYDVGGFGVTATGTYVGRTFLDDQFVLSNFPTADYPELKGIHDPAFRISPQFYLDAQIRFRTKNGFEFYVGGFNLANNKPPYLADIGADAGEDTLAGTYDALLRRFYAGVRIKI